jgi:hypothetical protein
MGELRERDHIRLNALPIATYRLYCSAGGNKPELDR